MININYNLNRLNITLTPWIIDIIMCLLKLLGRNTFLLTNLKHYLYLIITTKLAFNNFTDYFPYNYNFIL